MQPFITLIIEIIGIFCAIYGLYYVVTGLFGFIRMHKSFIKNHPSKHKFAVLVAARNEENIIDTLIHSLQKQDYPKYLYDIYVIPNNCTDKTAEVALNAGAKIIDCDVPVKNKGDVLRYTFKYLKDKDDIDAYVIFDADNVVHKNFLRRMNDALCEGYQIAQGNRDSKNPDDNWISGSHSIFFWMQNIFFNRSRMLFKCSASVNGTGFMIKKSVVDNNKYSGMTSSITEDLELTTQCLLNGVRIVFVEDAVTYDEQPVDFKASIVQRTRWTAGSMEIFSKYYSKLIKALFTKGNFSAFDFSVKLLAPLAQVLSALLTIYGIIMHILNSNVDNIGLTLAIDALGAIISYLFSVVLCIFIVKYYEKSIVKMMPSILLFPLFILTYIPICLKCLFSTKIDWVEMKHTRKINIDQLLNKKDKQKSL